jgi:hypothetical protein
MVKLCEKTGKKVAAYATAPSTCWCAADPAARWKVVPCGFATVADADGPAVDRDTSRNRRLNLGF